MPSYGTLNSSFFCLSLFALSAQNPQFFQILSCITDLKLKLIFGVQVIRLLSLFQIRFYGSLSTSKPQFYKLESSIWFVSFVLPVLIYVCCGYVSNCVTFYVSSSFIMIFQVSKARFYRPRVCHTIRSFDVNTTVVRLCETTPKFIVSDLNSNVSSFGYILRLFCYVIKISLSVFFNSSFC